MAKRISIIAVSFFIIFSFMAFSEELKKNVLFSEESALKSDEDLITINVSNVPIADVLQILSKKRRVNIVAEKSVKGNVSVNLYDVTFKEALDAVVKANGYSYAQKGNIVFVYGGEIGKEMSSNILDKEIRFYKIDHADTEETYNLIEKMLTSYGKAVISKEEKSIIVEDLPSNIKTIDALVKKIDTAPRQVMIEAKILEARLNNQDSFGVDWESIGKDDVFKVEGFTKLTEGFSYVLDKDNFDLVLKALTEKSNVKTIASPKLLAIDGKEASIIIGSQLGYRVTTTINQVTTESVEFLDVGTKLVITPKIANDNFITMEVHPEVSDGEVVLGLPSKRTTEATTNIIVKDGGTIVIGGLINNKREETRNQIPFLGSIPLLGYIFRFTKVQNIKSEIIVFITPHIVRQEASPVMAADLEKEKYMRESSRLDDEIEKIKREKIKKSERGE
ncbi:MAG: hypothetical protein D6734_05060 [Candidatus Schekmanbacteria bacterium]|nr:MAG: hypothetical protein D6734_05060 [Candidatus Schekmanbacteria bacterium]